MEDLTKADTGTEENFKVIDQRKCPSLDHVLLIMKTLAKFHGACYRFFNEKQDDRYKGKKPSHLDHYFLSACRDGNEMDKEQIRKGFQKPISVINAPTLNKPFYTSTIKYVATLLQNRKCNPEMIEKLKKYPSKYYEGLTHLEQGIKTVSDKYRPTGK